MSKRMVVEVIETLRVFYHVDVEESMDCATVQKQIESGQITLDSAYGTEVEDINVISVTM